MSSTKERNEKPISKTNYPDNEQKEKEIEFTNIKTMLYISIAYASTIGGCATLTGTGTNLLLTGALERYIIILQYIYKVNKFYLINF